jgi:hypothetical protein
VEYLSITIGVDIGQKVDPTAIVVAEQYERPSGRMTTRQLFDPLRRAYVDVPTPEQEAAFRVRRLERLPLGTAYPSVAQRVAAIGRNLHTLAGAREPKARLELHYLVDATGVGRPVVDILQAELLDVDCILTAVTFTYGDRLDRHGTREYRLGKAYLVSRLQALMQTNRLQLPASSPEAAVMVDELLAYQIKVDPDGHDKYGAFHVGSHDDLVTALGLAVLNETGRLGATHVDLTPSREVMYSSIDGLPLP